MDGILHIRAYDAKKKAPVDGGAIKGSSGSTVFVPEQPDGTVEVKLVMPGSEILFEPVVAYEELREVKNEVASDTIIAEHKDITNEDQTVMVTMLAADVAPLIQTGDKIALQASVALVTTIGFSRYAGGGLLVNKCW